MKFKLLILLLSLTILSCKNEPQQSTSKISETKTLTTVERIANAHGFEHWKDVKTFAFTFGGNYEEPTSGRSWVWNPKTNDVSLTRQENTSSYNRNNMDSIAIKSDRAFINDKFWALIPILQEMPMIFFIMTTT